MSDLAFARAFKIKRNTLGLTRSQCAKFLGVSISYIKKIELGSSFPSVYIAETMDKAISTVGSWATVPRNNHTLLSMLSTPSEYMSVHEALTLAAAADKLTLKEILDIRSNK